MNLNSHIRTLRARHDKLDATIQRDEDTPGSNHLLLHEMKKQRLKLKEELAGLEMTMKKSTNLKQGKKGTTGKIGLVKH